MIYDMSFIDIKDFLDIPVIRIANLFMVENILQTQIAKHQVSWWSFSTASIRTRCA